jgi:hypothetical protein
MITFVADTKHAMEVTYEVNCLSNSYVALAHLNLLYYRHLRNGRGAGIK